VAEVELHPGARAFPALSQYEDLLSRVRGIAGVEAAGFSRIGQLAGGFISAAITVPGESLTPEQRAEREDAIEQSVSPGFLNAMGTPILSGRDVADSDTPETPQVALVNETFVRLYLHGDDAVGRRFSTQGGDYRVVGVVEDTKWVDLREDSRPMFYRPFRQSHPPGATFAVRTSRPLHAVADSLRRQAAAAGLALRDIVPFTEVVNRTLVTERLLAFLSGGIGLLALLIVAVGLYGVMAYSVARRTNELGIRRALGATGAQLQWLVLRESLWLFGIGVTVGIVIVALTAPVAASLLFGLAAIDVPTIAGTIGLLLAVTLAASSGPARRASRVDPLVALRTE
jgi:predicted permease